jgi:hypothetical protein
VKQAQAGLLKMSCIKYGGRFSHFDPLPYLPEFIVTCRLKMTHPFDKIKRQIIIV